MLIHVTSEHIKNGQKGKRRECPIALALVDMGFDEAFVGALIIYVTKNHHSQYFIHSKQSRTFMSHFDRGLSVHPLTIELLEQVDAFQSRQALHGRGRPLFGRTLPLITRKEL